MGWRKTSRAKRRRRERSRAMEAFDRDLQWIRDYMWSFTPDRLASATEALLEIERSR